MEHVSFFGDRRWADELAGPLPEWARYSDRLAAAIARDWRLRQDEDRALAVARS